MLLWRLLSALLVVYVVLVSMRALLSWFPASVHGRYWRILLQLTDPYLNLFRGLRGLRRGPFDFTALAAIMVLVVALDIVGAILRYGRLTLALLGSVAINALWTGVSFLFLFFLVLAVLRLLSLLFVRRYDSPIGSLLEAMVRPALAAVRVLLPRAWHLKESHLLLVLIALLTGLRLLGGLLVYWLLLLLRAPPV